MKALAFVVLLAAVGALLWQKGVIGPKPEPPPPPPAILSEPAPIISGEELQKVLRSTQDPEADVRWEAVVFLDKVRAPQALPLMKEMLQRDAEPSVRSRIVGLLGSRGGPDALPPLVGALRDPEADVRLAALRALEQIGDFSVAGIIAGGPTRDQDERVRLQAMRTLNALQDARQKQIEEARQRYEAEKAAAAAKNR